LPACIVAKRGDRKNSDICSLHQAC
jgi:hypothetical protein